MIKELWFLEFEVKDLKKKDKKTKTSEKWLKRIKIKNIHTFVLWKNYPNQKQF